METLKSLDKKEEETLSEEEYQEFVKKHHKTKKKRLINLGKQKNTAPYRKKAQTKRSKSAPVGFGGS